MRPKGAEGPGPPAQTRTPEPLATPRRFVARGLRSKPSHPSLGSHVDDGPIWSRVKITFQPPPSGLPMNDGPLGYAITWTTYGTFLPGDPRGWRHRDEGPMAPSAGLYRHHQQRLKHPVAILSPSMRAAASVAVDHLCRRRRWVNHVFNPRTNHAHFVVSASGVPPEQIRDQAKAEILKQLRRQSLFDRELPLWTAKGDIQFLDTAARLEAAVVYASETQDRKERDRR